MKTENSSRGYMRKLIPSPSMVVALLALIVATSGTAYAAAKINGKNIKKGTITTTQIKNKTIAGADIKNATITGSKIKGATITADKLAAGVIPTYTPAPIGTVTSKTAFTLPGLLGNPNVTGMTLNYTVPEGANKIVATFSASCEISSTADNQSVIARITVDGVAMDPNDYASFCSPGDEDGSANTGSGGDTVNTGGSITRSITATPGQHTVQVQAIQGLATPGSFDNMSLVVMSGS